MRRIFHSPALTALLVDFDRVLVDVRELRLPPEEGAPPRRRTYKRLDDSRPEGKEKSASLKRMLRGKSRA